jgi:hypothetical protein
MGTASGNKALGEILCELCTKMIYEAMRLYTKSNKMLRWGLRVGTLHGGLLNSTEW